MLNQKANCFSLKLLTGYKISTDKALHEAYNNSKDACAFGWGMTDPAIM